MQWIALLLNLAVLSYQEVTIHLLEFGTFQNYWKNYQNRVILIMKVRLDANHNLTNKFWIWKPKSAWRAIKNPITKPNPTMRTTPIPSSDLTTWILNLIIFRNLFGRWKWRWKCWWWSTRTIKRLKVNFSFHYYAYHMSHVSIILTLRSISPVSSEDEVFNEDDAVDFFKVQSESEQVCMTCVFYVEIKLMSRS